MGGVDEQEEGADGRLLSSNTGPLGGCLMESIVLDLEGGWLW